MRIKQKIFFFISGCALLIYSCSSTKYVPDNQQLLADATVKVDAKDISSFDLEPYIKQKSNYKTFELFKFPLFVYNLSGRDTTKWYNRTLKHAGEPPVIYDSTQINRTLTQLSRIMENKGYQHAEIEPGITEGDKRVKIVFDIKSNEPTRIADYKININDTVFDRKIIDHSFPIPERFRKRMGDTATTINLNSYLSYGKLLKKGDQMDLDLLNAERERVTSILNRNGYMAFSKDILNL